MVGTHKAADCEAASSPWLGYQTGLFNKYNKAKELGRGGNGVVFTVVDRESGVEYACKSIRKVLPDASEKKKSGHLESIRRWVPSMFVGARAKVGGFAHLFHVG